MIYDYILPSVLIILIIINVIILIVAFKKQPKVIAREVTPEIHKILNDLTDNGYSIVRIESKNIFYRKTNQ
jgi:hypothetical protein